MVSELWKKVEEERTFLDHFYRLLLTPMTTLNPLRELHLTQSTKKGQDRCRLGVTGH